MSDWIDYDLRGMGKMRPFKEAREFIRKLKLKDQYEWVLYCKNELKGFKKRPVDIPAGPHNLYKDEWIGISDWLGNGKIAQGDWMPFNEARSYVQNLKLKTHEEWVSYCQNKLKGFKKKPIEIPTNPQNTYKDEWIGVGDWLGTGKVAQGDWMPFKEARAYIRKLKLKNKKEWILYRKNKLKGFKDKPHEIPTGPERVYKDEWKDLSDWLGKKNKSFPN